MNGINVKDVPWRAFALIALAAILYSALVFDFSSPAAFVEWLSTFMAAILSVFAGIFLYRHQSERTTAERQDQLLTNLAAELQMSLWMLPKYGDDEVGEVVLIPLPSVVVKEAIRSAVFKGKDSLILSNIAAHIDIYNSEVFLSSLHEASRTEPMLDSQHVVEELKDRQGEIARLCRQLLANLKSRGIEPPIEDPVGLGSEVNNKREAPRASLRPTKPKVERPSSSPSSFF